jgi:hypothetical protein
VEIKTQIYKVLAHGADPNPGAGLAPLREGVDSTRVSPFAFAFHSLRGLIRSLNSCPFVGSRVCSQCATGGHLTRGHGEAGSESCPRQEVAGAEIEKASLECHPDGGKDTWGGYPLQT